MCTIITVILSGKRAQHNLGFINTHVDTQCKGEGLVGLLCLILRMGIGSGTSDKCRRQDPEVRMLHFILQLKEQQYSRQLFPNQTISENMLAYQLKTENICLIFYMH